MCNLSRLIILCLLTSLCGMAYAQTKTSQLGGTAIISADEDEPYGNVQSVIELLKEHSIENLKFQLVETSGLTVTIVTKSNAENYADLRSLLQKAGVDNTEIRTAPIDWIDFSFSKLESKQKTTGTIVMLRADWCATCEHLETKSFAENELLRLIHESGVPFMKADITDSYDADSQSVQLANQVGANHVPAFVVYPPESSEKPLVIRDAFDSAAISKLLKEHFPSKQSKEDSSQ